MTISPTVMALARRIWNDLPGDHADRTALAKTLAAAIRVVREETKPPVSLYGSHRAVAPIIDKMIGKTLAEADHYRVPIGGVSIHVPTIFRAAQNPSHPFYAASKAFLDEHGLKLETTHTGRHPKLRIARQRTAAEVLESTRQRIGQTLSTRDTYTTAAAQSVHAANAIMCVSRAVWSTANSGVNMASTMTDHSGGKVSTIAVERGDGQ